MLHSFSRTVVLGFPLSLWHNYSQVFGSSEECWASHGVGLNFRYWLVTSKTFMPLLHQCILYIVSVYPAIVEQVVCSWVGVCLSPLVRAEFFQYHKHQSEGMKALGKHQLNFFMLNELYRYYLLL